MSLHPQKSNEWLKHYISPKVISDLTSISSVTPSSKSKPLTDPYDFRPQCISHAPVVTGQLINDLMNFIWYSALVVTCTPSPSISYSLADQNDQTGVWLVQCTHYCTFKVTLMCVCTSIYKTYNKSLHLNVSNTVYW